MNRARMSSKRRRRVKARMAEAQGWRCAYCGCTCTLQEFTFDHVIPQVLGGTNGVYNLVLACEPCNLAKGSNILVPRGTTGTSPVSPARPPSRACKRV